MNFKLQIAEIGSMKSYLVDLDYESYLFNPNYHPNAPEFLKINKEFEYVFFIVNKEKCILKNQRDYDKNYLNKMSKLGFVIPEFNKVASNEERWWGNHHDYDLEKKLNSKLTSAALAQEFNWGFKNGKIVKSLEELKNHLYDPSNQSFVEWIIKKPHSFSGQGHYRFSKDKINYFIIEKVLTEPVLLEPLLERVLDLGTTFQLSGEGKADDEDVKINKQFTVLNFNNEQGGFRGGAGSHDQKKLSDYVLNKFGIDLTLLYQETEKIAQKYIELGAKKNIQIDSFYYKDPLTKEVKPYFLCEVNYRKTMGLVIQSLADMNAHYDIIEWHVRSKKEIDLDANFYTTGEQIRLSPDGTHFLSYLRYL
jgi:hypothetical protein